MERLPSIRRATLEEVTPIVWPSAEDKRRQTQELKESKYQKLWENIQRIIDSDEIAVLKAVRWEDQYVLLSSLRRIARDSGAFIQTHSEPIRRGGSLKGYNIFIRKFPEG